MDSIQKTTISSGISSRAIEIDDDMFKLPEKSNLSSKKTSDDEYINEYGDEIPDDIDDEIIRLTTGENIPSISKTIDFNSYFTKNQLDDSETFFKVEPFTESTVLKYFRHMIVYLFRLTILTKKFLRVCQLKSKWSIYQITKVFLNLKKVKLTKNFQK